MSNLTFFLAAAFFLAGGVSLTGQSEAPGPTSWSGVIINSGCTAEEAFNEAAKCTEKTPDARLILYSDTTRKMYDLEPQDQATGHLGDSVTVRGTLEGNIIHVSSLALHTVIGLPVGQKAPDFSLRDQLGREHTLESLRGTKGTVLLFFRSADW